MINQSDSLEHEALDRVHVVTLHFAEFVQAHPYIVANPKLAEQAQVISDALGELYQSVAQTR